MKANGIVIVIGVGVLVTVGGVLWFQTKQQPAAPVPSAAANNAVTNSDPVQPQGNPKTETVTSKQDYGQIGFDLIKQEALGSLHDGLQGSTVVQTLGEPEEKSEATEWGADGMVHQTWSYPSKGIELDMMENEQKQQVINMITINAPCTYRTKRGIGIGSKREDVMAAYQKEINQEETQQTKSDQQDSIIAGTSYGGVIFGMENDAVTSIFIGTAAE